MSFWDVLTEEYKGPFMTAFSVLTGLIIGGTLAYHYMEGWSIGDSFYFVISTLTTVGYGDMGPSTEAARVFTALFMLAGVGVSIAALGIIGTALLRNWERLMESNRTRIDRQEALIQSLKERIEEIQDDLHRAREPKTGENAGREGKR